MKREMTTTAAFIAVSAINVFFVIYQLIG